MVLLTCFGLAAPASTFKEQPPGLTESTRQLESGTLQPDGLMKTLRGTQEVGQFQTDLLPEDRKVASPAGFEPALSP